MRNSTLRANGSDVILYPFPCAICNIQQPPPSDAICLKCSYDMPKTDFHLRKKNEFTDRFWGRIFLEAGAAAFYFRKKESVQKMLHSFKYKNRPEIGFFIGFSYGLKLAKSELFQSVDCIIPVPLHPRKLRQRGYNQSALFANGISAAMGIPTIKNVLIRTENSDSQTRKGAIERLINVEEVFKVKPSKSLIGKHILLVDDVMTTGSTLEACAIPLLKLKNTKLSMVTMAIAIN